MEVPKKLTVEKEEAKVEIEVEEKASVDVKERKGKFWDKFKNNLIDLFKEEEDQVIK